MLRVVRCRRDRVSSHYAVLVLFNASPVLRRLPYKIANMFVTHLNLRRINISTKETVDSAQSRMFCLGTV